MLTLYILLILWFAGFTIGLYVLALGFVSWLDNRETKVYSYDCQEQAWRLFDDIQ